MIVSISTKKAVSNLAPILWNEVEQKDLAESGTGVSTKLKVSASKNRYKVINYFIGNNSLFS